MKRPQILDDEKTRVNNVYISSRIGRKWFIYVIKHHYKDVAEDSESSIGHHGMFLFISVYHKYDEIKYTIDKK